MILGWRSQGCLLMPKPSVEVRRAGCSREEGQGHDGYEPDLGSGSNIDGIIQPLFIYLLKIINQWYILKNTKKVTIITASSFHSYNFF